MKLTFWGTRGSIPSPGIKTIRYGGNTPCVELRMDNDELFILDAGSGIRALGKKLLQENKSIKATILISHTHWDHIQGFPFFSPLAFKENEFKIIGGQIFSKSLKKVLSNQMDSVYFPIRLNEYAATVNFFHTKEEVFDINGTKIETIYANHPHYALGYKIIHNGKTLIYITDNEPLTIENISKMKTKKFILKKFLNSGTDPNQRIYDFCKNADVFIHDSTYTSEEYKNHIGWGHSDYLFTLKIAEIAKVKHCVLFHHNVDRSDDELDEIVEVCRKKVSNTSIQISAAIEGSTIEI